jgi:hypothetical protein
MNGAMPIARTACAPTLEAVFALISGCRVAMEVEHRAQADVMAVLVSEFGVSAVSREHRLGPGDRPDFFLTGGLVIEMKGPRHRQPAVLRQLARYAAYPQVTGIILATSRAMVMPAVIGGKPVAVINLGRAWL